MRVLVTAVAQPTGISGVQRHAFNLVHCLLQRPEIGAVHLALAPWQQHLPALAGLEPGDRLRIEIASTQRGALARNLWHLRELPALARAVRADLVHLTHPVPFRSASMPCPVVMTLHDLYPFEIPGNFRFPQVIVNRWILRSALSQADAVCCVSRTTLDRLQVSGLGVASAYAVVPNCVEPSRTVSACSPVPGWNGEMFLLSVAQHRRNKNLDLLLRTFGYMFAKRSLPPTARLVIVGMEGPETEKLHALVRHLNLPGHVDFLEGLSNAELQWCYLHCTAMVAPSLTEGFGLPIVEARLAGARIVCSDIPAFRELAAPSMHFVNLRENPEMALSAAIEEALLQSRPKPERIRELESNSIAEQYMTLYLATLTLPAGIAHGSHANVAITERPAR
jgi:glycosyltransferase involved in cell wall biosynthesis